MSDLIVDGININKLIESNVYKGDFGHNYINIPNYALDFSQQFVFMGFTKSNRIRLGEIFMHGPNGIKYIGKLAKFDGKYLTVCGDRYLKSIAEMQKDAKLVKDLIVA